MSKKLGMFCGCFVLLLGGCLSFDPKKDQSVFFVLKPLAKEESMLARHYQDIKVNGLGIREVRLPDYLDRRQVVWFSEDGVIDFSENELWAESLQEGVRRVLLENLRKSLGTTNVQVVPWQELFRPKYELFLDIVEWRALVGKEIKLVAYWQVVRNEPVVGIHHSKRNPNSERSGPSETMPVVVHSNRTEVVVPVKDWDDTSEITQGMSESLNLLVERVLKGVGEVK